MPRPRVEIFEEPQSQESSPCAYRSSTGLSSEVERTSPIRPPKNAKRATPAKARYPVNHARETKNQSLKKNLGLCVGFDAHAELVFRFDSCVTAPCVQNCCQLRAKRAESSALPRTRLRGRSWLCTCQRPCFVPLCAATARQSQRLGEASHPGPRRAKTTA